VASNIANIGMNIANSAIGAIKKDEKDKQWFNCLKIKIIKINPLTIE
jgi:hypothetical protein